MKELNDDGLVPGQAVDFATIHRVNSQRKPAVETNKPPRAQKAAKNG